MSAQIVAQGLLSSGYRENISFAERLLTLSSSVEVQSNDAGSWSWSPKGSPLTRRKGLGPVGSSTMLEVQHVPLEASIKLVVEAAREYFNSSANTLDSDMALAR